MRKCPGEQSCDFAGDSSESNITSRSRVSNVISLVKYETLNRVALQVPEFWVQCGCRSNFALAVKKALDGTITVLDELVRYYNSVRPHRIQLMGIHISIFEANDTQRFIL
jgi:hypothetical protein